MSAELVLLIADEEQTRVALAGPLSRAGYTVASASSVEGALAAVAGREPELVLLDLAGGAVVEIECSRRLRELRELEGALLVISLDSGEVELAQRAFEAGVDELLIAPLRPGELVARVRSVTRARRSERALRIKNQQLLRAQQQKDELGALVVHELRNPLAAVTTNAAYLLELGALRGDEEQALRDIVSAAESLRRMVLNLVDLYQSEEGALPLRTESIDSAELVFDVVRAMKWRASERAHELITQIEREAPVFEGDAELLQRVLENLVDNAIRNTPRRGKVELGCRRVGDLVEFAVLDQGPGVPEELKARVFDKYVRLESKPEGPQRTGRGLGLPYCKAVVEAHGGTIDVESPERGGACFVVRLPLVSRVPRRAQRSDTKSS